jgi:hypothetical protein
MKGFCKLLRNISPSDDVAFPSDIYELNTQVNNKLVHPFVYNLARPLTIS